MIIDTHVHAFNKRNLHNVDFERKYFRCNETSGDFLVYSMDAARVDKAFLISIAAHSIAATLRAQGVEPEAMTKVICHEYAADVFHAYPGRFYWFTAALPVDPQWRTQLAEHIRSGISGVKLLPGFASVFPDAPEFFEIYEACRSESLPVIIDFSYWCINVPGFLQMQPRDFRTYLTHARKIMEAFPDVHFQVAHYGTPDPLYEMLTSRDYEGYEPFIEFVRDYPNVWVDLAALPPPPEEEYPFPSVRAFIHHLVERWGSKRIMYGTDWPYFYNGQCCCDATYKQGVDMIRKDASFDEATKRDLLGGNALAFLGDRQ